MIFPLILAAISQVEPGPLDALRANMDATHVKLTTERTSGSLAAREFSESRIWKGELGFVPDDKLTIVGRYETDGNAEYFCFASAGWMPQSAQASIAGNADRPTVPKQQLLFDGEMTVRREGEDKLVNVILTEDPAIPQGIGPYLWDAAAPFPLILKQQFPNFRPERFASTRDGHPTETEVYHRIQSDGWHQLEIYYDVDSGYVPRFIRMVKSSKDQSRGFVRMTYVTSIRSCSSGGFVPAEWYSLFFIVVDFDKKYPNYKHDVEIIPRTPFSVDHFRVTNLEDLKQPVRLEDGKGVTILSSFGGQSAAKGLEDRMTIANVRGALGMKLRNTPGPIIPHVAANEVAGLTHSVGRWWMPYVIIAGLSALMFGVWKVRSRNAAYLLLAVTVLGNCGCDVAQPVVHITGSFARTYVLHEPNTTIPLELILKNDGNQPVRITHVDGGCSCRQVDQASLPVTLKPGQPLKMAVTMLGGKRFEPLNIMFSIDTDHGKMSVPSLIYTMPSLHVSPEAPVNDSLVEDQPWDLTLAQRSVYPRSDRRPQESPIPISSDKSFGIVKESVSETNDDIPGFVIEETIYRLTLLDRSLGIHKTIVDIKDAGGRRHLEVPITWRRSPFLSTSPDKVSLGLQPVRAFLRCADQDVELTEVIDVPAGIKAVISGRRELNITLLENAPGVINGVVRVKTSAAGRDPLLVPVVRYKPSIASR